MATRLINNLGEGGPSSCVISVGSWVVHTCISVKLFKTNILEACWIKLWDNLTNMVISCVAYSCTNQQKTGSNISLFSGNLCCKCLCCVSVYVNECNSFENVLKYQYLGGAYIKCFPVVTLIGCNIKCYRGRIQFYK